MVLNLTNTSRYYKESVLVGAVLISCIILDHCYGFLTGVSQQHGIDYAKFMCVEQIVPNKSVFARCLSKPYFEVIFLRLIILFFSFWNSSCCSFVHPMACDPKIENCFFSLGKEILVHCTHEINRTGYLIARYMIEFKGMEPIPSQRDLGRPGFPFN